MIRCSLTVSAVIRQLQYSIVPSKSQPPAKKKDGSSPLVGINADSIDVKRKHYAFGAAADIDFFTDLCYNDTEKESQIIKKGMIQMKRVLALLTALLLVLAMFTACGAKKNVDLNTVLNDVNSKHGLASLTKVEDTSGLNRYYKVAAEDVKQFAAELTKSASEGYTEVILIEATNADAAGKIKDLLETHRQDQLGDAKSYHPEQVNMIEACSAKTSGSFVWLVISDKQADINADIEKALK